MFNLRVVAAYGKHIPVPHLSECMLSQNTNKTAILCLHVSFQHVYIAPRTVTRKGVGHISFNIAEVFTVKQ
jgi:hypothetical protein